MPTNKECNGFREGLRDEMIKNDSNLWAAVNCIKAKIVGKWVIGILVSLMVLTIGGVIGFAVFNSRKVSSNCERISSLQTRDEEFEKRMDRFEAKQDRTNDKLDKVLDEIRKGK